MRGGDQFGYGLVDISRALGPHGDGEGSGAQFDIQGVEVHFRIADLALAIVEHFHVVADLAQHIADPGPHDGLPPLVGAFVGRVQIRVGAHVHDETRRVAHGGVLRAFARMGANNGRANMGVAPIDFEDGLLGGDALIQIEHERQRRS